MISIVIPVHNLREMTMFCIEMIESNAKGLKQEIILVDNGSDPPYKGNSKIKTIRNEENKGFPFAVNQGIAAAKGDWVCLLNNDVIVPENWLKRLLAHENYADIIGPRTNFSCGLQSTALRWVYNDIKEFWEVSEKVYEEYKDQYSPVNWLIGFCLLIRKEVFDSIGGMDLAYGLGNYEDIDFCLRARKEGFRIVIAKDVFVHHFGSFTHKELGIDYVKLQDENHSIFIKKWGNRGFQQEAEEG